MFPKVTRDLFFTSGNAEYERSAHLPSPSSPASLLLWWCPPPAPDTLNPWSAVPVFDGVSGMKPPSWKEDAGLCMRQQRNKPRFLLSSLTLPAAPSRWMNQSLSRELSSGLPLLHRHLIWENFNHVCFPMFRPNDKSFLMGGWGWKKKM